ncbi:MULTISPECIES: hypothetical protein [Psychrobacter]|uniref:hypothetical protein n=1 Tax=Psychrobacter TaxID=497 RepID=UPI0012FF23E0|nr:MULTISPECIES: hypothetical protein [Psychrobacter]
MQLSIDRIILWEVVIAKVVMGADRAFCLYLYLRAGRSLLADGIPAQRYYPQPSDAARSDAQDTATVTAKKPSLIQV